MPYGFGFSLRLAAIAAVAAGIAVSSAKAASISPIADNGAASSVLGAHGRDLGSTLSTGGENASSRQAWQFAIRAGDIPDPAPVHAAIPLFLSGLAAVGVISRRPQTA